ncbi:hypothetical protein MIMGU_mgv1a019528mg [Erythranthe guttata]|uniref:Uncharacterized protein n=1 Tax=Erythranthe guttata TaxID=4155 RepID=A0A022R392_ERYGU|nr:hypothetical protein MIMGU_mgv1a019528mg [Erythranthe guttata]
MKIPSSGLDDDPNKKIRKPYTITKSRESWSHQEHHKFLQALHLFDRDWKKIEEFVGSKTVIQIRSHAQKYFLKVQKNGTTEHVPPPRPKRKASHPYPQNAPKKGSTFFDFFFPMNLIIVNFNLRGVVFFFSSADIGLACNYSSSSNESTPRVWKDNETLCQVKKYRTTKGFVLFCFQFFIYYFLRRISFGLIELNVSVEAVVPDFAQVYGFIGSVFDPEASDDHLKRLKKMDPIDIETVLLLMKNLCVNLASPEFEDHAFISHILSMK